ncbi:TIGR03862 family flavoprotein [Alphaproteobacteria bacterium GH1-50]|uniref:TIGR03862 family flavoprotein n=1 Tax=Kangsaoukella pontilimi TaxID=2691042 RepID=A0A7C9N2K9_9RHOB|nr:TIGR03862 family flavoprotein [Kangsaoukella pontilimi]MXQ09438.1 TIGR03862 family flavoprotein [Kangsaoukella pontilimi]
MADETGAKGAEDKTGALVIGGGPAGLMAAEVLSAAGLPVVVADAMPSVGRKFLMAGKSGLNLTKDEGLPNFLPRVSTRALDGALTGFGPAEVMAWAEGLGQPLFTGSTGRVFPKAMKASPLLRAWLARLEGQGVELRTRWRWTGWDGDACLFETPEGARLVRPRVTVLALGGASWRRLGSDGAWSGVLAADGHAVVPFRPANMGFRVDWSDHMARHFGTPVKGTRLVAGDEMSRGEWVVTAKGIEGGGVYEVSRALREGATLTVDLAPDLDVETVTARIARPRGKASLSNHLRRVLKLSPVARALLTEWGRPLPDDPARLAALIKALPVGLKGPLDMDGAISTAGGVSWEALDGLMLKARPGTFVAGEMLDWEAPTGGYLLTGCFASGKAAGEQAIGWLGRSE